MFVIIAFAPCLSTRCCRNGSNLALRPSCDLALMCQRMSKKRHRFFDADHYRARTAEVIEYQDGHLIKTHSHPWHQLVYASRGVMTVRTTEGTWVVPPHLGVWVPCGVRHSIEMSGAVSLRTVYLVPSLSDLLPYRCGAIAISP